MNDMIAWIRAEADRPEDDEEGGQQLKRSGAAFPAFAKNAKDGALAASVAKVRLHGLVAHQFPARVADRAPAHRAETSETRSAQVPPFAESAKDGAPGVITDASPLTSCEIEDRSLEDDRQRRIYRGRTVAMLRRYMRYSIETGRLPSMLGQEFFRSKVTSYRVATFEDRVIFVHDLERCLQRLDEFSRQVLGRVVLQEYEHEQAARLLGCTRMTVHRKLLEALDKLSDILIEVGLLDALPSRIEKPCQEGGDTDFLISDYEQGK